MPERRPWWLFIFALPLCCGASLLGLAAGAGGSGIVGSAVLGAFFAGPWAALALGSLFGASIAIPLLAIVSRRTHVHGATCARACGTHG